MLGRILFLTTIFFFFASRSYCMYKVASHVVSNYSVHFCNWTSRVWALGVNSGGSKVGPTPALPSGFLIYWSYTTASVTVLYVRSYIRATARHAVLLFVN